MKKRLIGCFSLLLMLMMLTGCQPAGSQTTAKPTAKPTDAKDMQRLVNNTYGKYFGIHKLSCGDDGFNDDGSY